MMTRALMARSIFISGYSCEETTFRCAGSQRHETYRRALATYRACESHSKYHSELARYDSKRIDELVPLRIIQLVNLISAGLELQRRAFMPSPRFGGHFVANFFGPKGGLPVGEDGTLIHLVPRFVDPLGSGGDPLERYFIDLPVGRYYVDPLGRFTYQSEPWDGAPLKRDDPRTKFSPTPKLPKLTVP